MPQLKNLKHEAFALKFHAQLKDPTKEPSAKQAYKEVYGNKKKEQTLEVNASRTMAKPEVRDRLLELFNNDPDLNDDGLKTHMSDMLRNAKDGVRLGVVQTVLKVQGRMKETQTNTQNNIIIDFGDKFAAKLIEISAHNSLNRNNLEEVIEVNADNDINT